MERFEFNITIKKDKKPTEKSEETFEKITREEKEKHLDIKETLNNIKSHIQEQPTSIQRMIERGILIENDFSKITNIDNKNFIFSKINGNNTIALVQDKENPNKYKTRVFRFSGSDHQWKSIAGLRLDDSYMKGDEKNPLHHYVQSAKLHKDMYQIINDLPQEKSNYEVEDFLPKEYGNNDKNAPWEELEFKENHQILKNKEWASYQKFCQEVYKKYIQFVTAANQSSCKLNGKLYKSLIPLESIQEFKNIKDILEKVNKNNPNDYLFNNHSRLSFCQRSRNPEFKKIADVYNENISKYIEKCFMTPPPETMIPNFSLENCIDKYVKKGLKKEDDIFIEEYKISSPEGDELVFAMAYDNKGRVYIDNIYDPRVSVNDYGVLEQITQMGFLIYKPEDYTEQIEFGFPKKYLGEKINHDKYTDINALWRNIPIIKKYRDELITRGIIK